LVLESKHLFGSRNPDVRRSRLGKRRTMRRGKGT
jgi:hypothetical protein